MALNATRWYARMLWVALSLFSVGIFVYQCVLVLQKFQRKDKIVSVELQFESASFPAVTVCNLNPFKTHLARRVPEISETLDAYHQAVTYSKDAAKHYDTSSARYRRNTNPGGFRYVQYEPVMSDCDCDAGSMKDNGECVQKDTIPKNNLSLCICNYDRQDSTAWPCFSANSWADSVCPECVDLGYCNLPQTKKTSGTDHHIPCLCQRDVKYCLLRPERLKRMWEIRGNQIPEEGSPFRADFLAQLKELGYENMTDGVAISTKTKEKLILTMAGLPSQRRIALSYGKTEFIRMCSFNGQQCNIINDFKLHVDPAFGNCYTFNANRDKPLVSSRAGPSYGLRLLVYINASDYLPTTEASGVRIAIHAQEEYPFPDTFGYSAPTGSVSSFGMSMRKVNRLCISGDCDCVSPNDPLPVDYIYRNYKYEPEGCFKSCYQNQIIRRCGCADPRYPTPRNDTKLCDSLDPLSRNCLLVEGIKFTRSHMCRCKHPCVHDVYTTTYSSAKLTPGAFQAVRCKAEDCIDDMDSESMAMLEIYYEQMSYEKLTEHESYLFVNFISDVGGQAGLWLGASVLTLIEIIVFLLRVMTIVCRRRFRKGDINEYKFSMDNPFSAKRYSDASGGMGIEKSVPPAPKPSTVGNDTKRDSLPPDIKLTLNPADAVDYSPRKPPRYDDTERDRTDTTEAPSDDDGDKDHNNTATDIADEDYDTYRNSLKPPDVDMYYGT
ncbi:DEL-1 protein [Aphelenchoides avenae]|nr:DEL-1 protein [Aphelenchus avenae]